MNETDKRLKKAMDTRTEQEFQQQYEAGHYNENIVFYAMKCPKYRLNTKKFIGDGGKYEPDCFMMLHGDWYPVDIKTSKFDIRTADFKEHQVRSLAKENGLILFATPQKMTILRAKEIIDQFPVVSAEESKVKHPAFRCQLTKWGKWDKPLYFK